MLTMSQLAVCVYVITGEFDSRRYRTGGANRYTCVMQGINIDRGAGGRHGRAVHGEIGESRRRADGEQATVRASDSACERVRTGQCWQGLAGETVERATAVGMRGDGFFLLSGRGRLFMLRREGVSGISWGLA